MIQTINKNKYKITVDCGKVNGKRKRISRIFNGNKKDAKILESELKKQIMNNDTSFIKIKELTFNEVIDMFMKDYCKTNLKENTIYGYKSLLVNIRKELGNNNIKDITTYTLQTFYNKLKTDYKYSSNTISHYYTLINNILEKAFKWDKISTNPNKQINKPKIIKEEASFYTQEDIKKLLSILENYSLEMKLPIILCIDTGFRREELNGLQ